MSTPCCVTACTVHTTRFTQSAPGTCMGSSWCSCGLVVASSRSWASRQSGCFSWTSNGLRRHLCPSRYSVCGWRAGHSPSTANRTRQGTAALRCIREWSDVHYCSWRRLGLLGPYGRHRAATGGEHVALAAPHLQLHQGHARAPVAARHFMPALLRLARRDEGVI